MTFELAITAHVVGAAHAAEELTRTFDDAWEFDAFDASHVRCTRNGDSITALLPQALLITLHLEGLHGGEIATCEVYCS